MSVVEDFKSKHPLLETVARELEKYLKDTLRDAVRVDRVSARAKTVASFEKKSLKVEKDGSPRYKEPLVEIQDQIGARVIVFFRSDVERVAAEVSHYFNAIEEKKLTPEGGFWAFGYFGRHFILPVPPEVLPADASAKKLVPEFFELQIKTLFQHAWSEGNHDLGYKPIDELSAEDQRCLAYAAAQAWGADREFEEFFVRQQSAGA